MSYIYDLTDTWNAAGTVFTSIKMNVTNSASASGSKLIDLQLAGTTFFNVDKSGNVGINIAAPSYRLHVVETSGTVAGFRASTANIAQILVGNTAGDLTMRTQSTGDGFIYSDTSKYLAFGTSATERMRITTAGDVGIGTTTPVARLEINGTQRISKAGAGFEPAMLSFSTLTETGAIYRIGMGTAGSFTIGRSDTSTTDITLSQQGNLGIGTTTPTARLHSYSAVGGSVLRLQTGTNANGVFADFRNDSAVRIGLVGFVDATNLYVHNDSAGAILFDTNNLERMRLDASGNLGIGTASPAFWSGKLTVDGGNIALANGGRSLFWNSGGTGLAAIQGVGTDALAFLTTNSYTERMRITGTGDVGIGTSTPTAKLDVNGQLNVPDQLAYDFTTSVLPDIAPTLNLNFVGANAVDPRITFTRSTTATYYDADTTALAEQNLMRSSQEFQNWSLDNATVTVNAGVAPDGTTTADKIIATAVTTDHGVYNNTPVTASANYTFSAYIKAAEQTFASLTGYDNNTFYATFNLTTGVVVNTAGIVSSSITSVGGGWYRCVITRTAPVSGTAFFYIRGLPGGTQGPYLGNGVDGILAWGAQVETRSVATAYIVTTTNPITNYIPQLMTAAINQPRLDFDPVTRAPKGFLIEEARTNILTYSEQFDNAIWGKTNSTIAANVIISPDGTADGDKLQEDSATAGHVIVANPTMAASTTYTLSIFMKAAERTFGVLNIYTGAASCWTWYNLSTGVVSTLGSGATATITPVGNGWYRCTLTIATAATGTPNVAIWPSNANGVLSYAGTTGYGIYIYGAQLEAGSFATSYIPTVATTVQRTADVATMTGTNFSPWYNQSEGTLFVEATISPNVDSAVGNYYASISDGTISNTIHIADVNGTVSQVVTGGVTQFSETVGSEPTGTLKAALAYAVNNTVSSANGAIGTTDTSVSLPTVNRLGIGSRGDLVSNGFASGHIRSVRFYPTRLSNATLQALTA